MLSGNEAMNTSILAPTRRLLRQSHWLRKVYNKLRTNSDLIRTRHIPEQAFMSAIKNELMVLRRLQGKQSLGDYLEFGVFNGTSLSCAYRALVELGLERQRCFGFDSFEGLPPDAGQDDGGAWFPGQFACRIDTTEKFLAARDIDRRRVKLVKGWFKDTLVDKTKEQYHIRKTSLVMMDCDLYSSTTIALDFIAPLLTDHSVIIFDDWHSHGLADKNLGEKKAFEEFLVKHPEFYAEKTDGYNELSQIVRLSRIEARETS